MVITDPRTFNIDINTLQVLATLEDSLKYALTALRSFQKAVECVRNLNERLRVEGVHSSGYQEVEKWLAIYREKSSGYIETVEDLLLRIESMVELVIQNSLIWSLYQSLVTSVVIEYIELPEPTECREAKQTYAHVNH